MNILNKEFDSKSFLNTLTHHPGVYRMSDSNGQLLYVGKAKDLRKRVTTYFRKQKHSTRIKHMLEHTSSVDITVTDTEAEALLLENTLIKEHKPKYNILLRDDKSYPYIKLTSDHKFPGLQFYRGSRNQKGHFYGPYPNAGAVRNTINTLQKLFKIRPCNDSFFNNRSRPCLQFQIKRCTAPCVNLITQEKYLEDIHLAQKFLEGRSKQVIDVLIKKMDTSSESRDYEAAVEYRDQIESLRQISEQQSMHAGQGNIDIIAIDTEGSLACVQVFNIRNGINLGNRSYYPKITDDVTEAILMKYFIGQYYLNREAPDEIIVSEKPTDHVILESMLKQKSNKRISIVQHVKKKKLGWLNLAKKNAANSLQTKLVSRSGMLQRFQSLQEELNLDYFPERIECFDVSHTSGTSTFASCVVFDTQGPKKTEYRRFNIKDVKPGDDYAAIKQAISRRYKRIKQGEIKAPDLLFVDGGKGQVSQAIQVLEELQLEEVLPIGIAKGAARKEGLETLYVAKTKTPLILSQHSLALKLIQHIRDEAHRFAIMGHRLQARKRTFSSPLETISGLGPKRKQALLKYFGGLRGVNRAGINELTRVPGISKRLAENIYDTLHTNVK